jgi:3-(3-hydroxy-phenyl)propionate hydroxylase
MIEHAVVISGAGPTGLMLAGELALAGVDVAIIERRPNQELDGPRARGIHARTIEELDQRGIAERFIAEGHKHEASMITGARFINDLPTRHNYVLGLLQRHIERLLAAWVGELEVPVLYGTELTGFTQDDRGVDVKLAGGKSLRAKYLVGCDGGRSLVRKTAGIDFPGWDATQSWLMAEARMTAEPPLGFREDARGKHAIGKAEGGLYGMVLIEAQVVREGEATLADIKQALADVYGSDFGIHSPRWVSRFTDMTRQAANYRDRRVLLAGDAAHLHSPIGGQGLGIGLQDAVNLGWKLAQVVKGTSPDTLLDTYHAERHPVAARMLRVNMAQVQLARTDERSRALRETMNEVLPLEQPSRKITAMMSGLDIHHVVPGDATDPHPLVGRRMPDLDLVTDDETIRVYTLLHEARPVLLNLGEPETIGVARWADRVQLVDAKYEGAWELPLVGAVPRPTAVLIRPDGYVAWVGRGTLDGLVEALSKWC